MNPALRLLPAAIAAGNSGSSAFEPQLRALTQDPSPVVAEAAGWALARLSGPVPAG